MKQRKYKIGTLTKGITHPDKLLDRRLSTYEMASYFSLAFNIEMVHGYVDDAIKYPSLIQFVKSHGLQLWTWGNALEDADVVLDLQNKGVSGFFINR